MKYFILYISIFYFTACQLFQSQQTTMIKTSTGKQQTEVFVPVNKELYVINSDALLYKTPDINSLGEPVNEHFATWHNIIGESAHFYKAEEEGKIFYFLKKDMGRCEQINFTKEVLEQSDRIVVNETDREGLSNFSQFLSVTPITRKEYLEKQENRVDLLKKDSALHPKKDHKLIFNCKNKVVIFKDELTGEEYYDKIYYYEGNIEKLNQYVVSLLTLGWIEYILVDKTTGKQTKINGYPYVSPGKKYIFCLIEGMDISGFMYLYEIESLSPFKIKEKLNIGFTYWTPYDDPKENDIFWDKDGNLYASINKDQCFYIDNMTRYNHLRQYIKIEIK